jgi:hypothetical protein
MTEYPAGADTEAESKDAPHGQEEHTAQSDRAYFLVTCHGWSGSHWLANALNLHKDITCGHSERILLATPENRASYKGEGLATTTHERQESRMARGTRPLEEYYDDLEEMGDTPVYGTVHTFRLRDLPVQAQLHPVQRPISILNMVRHPVSLVNSGFGHLREMTEYDIHVLLEVAETISKSRDAFVAIGAAHDLNLCDRDVFCFLGAAYHSIFLGVDLKAVPTIQHIMMEKATTDRPYFEGVVRSLTGDRIPVDQAYLDEVFALGEVNSHRIGGRKTPAERYASWQPWQREAFRHCLDKSGIQPTYAALGYDFSFL